MSIDPNSSEAPVQAQEATSLPSVALRTVQGSGTLVLAGIAGALTIGHALFYGPGYPGATFTGVLYTIIAVSLSPILFYTLRRSPGPDELRFLASWGAIFCATAPVFYAPSLMGSGLAAGVLLALLALLPPWLKQARLTGQMRALESSQPQALVDALKSPEVAIRTTARARLLELGDEALPALLRGYRRQATESTHLRSQILELLSALSKAPPDGVLRPAQLELAGFWQELAGTARDVEILTSAVSGLGRLKVTSAAGLLCGLLRTEMQRGGALPSAREPLCDALFEALAAIGEGLFKPGAEPAGGGIKAGREVVSTLLNAYLSTPTPRRLSAMAGLGAPLVAGVAAMLGDAPFPVRRELTRVLGAVRAMATVPLLIDLAQDRSNEIRLAAAQGLLNLLPAPGEAIDPGHPPLPETLRKQLLDACVRLAGDPEQRVRGAALEALSRGGDPQTLPLLLDYLGTPPEPGEDGVLRGLVAANLARSGDPLILDPLLRLLEDQNPAILAGAARGLGWFKDPRVAPRLKPMLEHPDRFVALSAAIGLAHQGDDSGRAVLQQAASGPLPVLRLEVLEALGKIADAAFVTLLEAGVAAPPPGWMPRERAWAVQRMIDLKAPESYAALERLWNNAALEPGVRSLLEARLMAAGMLTPESPAASSEPAQQA